MKKPLSLLLSPLLLLSLSLFFTSAAAQTVAQQSVEEGASEVYTLGAGDMIRIHVFGEPDLTFDSILVGESGKISFPFLGELTIKGLSLARLEGLLMEGLRPDYLIDPKISVSIVEYRPFFINGQVNSPGSYPYQPGLRLRQAISLAAGLTERASQSKIFVVHDSDPAAQRQRVDLNYNVRPGDTITIEESFF